MGEAVEEANGSSVWKDLLSGAVGGVAQVLIGRHSHPFLVHKSPEKQIPTLRTLNALLRLIVTVKVCPDII